MHVYASCCWTGIVFPPLHLIVQFGSRLRDENPDLMSRQANRNEECIGAVMWEDGPMSPWGIRVLSYRRWRTPARPHSFHLFPPPTLYLSFSLLNNSPCWMYGLSPAARHTRPGSNWFPQSFLLRQWCWWWWKQWKKLLLHIYVQLTHTWVMMHERTARGLWHYELASGNQNLQSLSS